MQGSKILLKMKLNERISSARKEKGITQEELADLSKVQLASGMRKRLRFQTQLESYSNSGSMLET